MALILVRPEVIKHADPQSLCRLSRTSKSLHTDLQGTKAWTRLAEAQLPPPTPRDEAEAIARVRSHVRRRLLAKAEPSTRRVLEGVTLLEALSRPAPAPVAFTPDELSDFTFFLRLTDGERLIWEGDLGDLSRQSDEQGLVLHLSLRQLDLQWSGRVDKIGLVAIRDADQAMVSLGLYDLDIADSELDGDGEQQYNFSPRGALFSSARSRLELWGGLCVTQDGYVSRLELRLMQCTRLTPNSEDFGNGPKRCNTSRLRHVLSYLAGIHHPTARAFVLARIESWLVEAERDEGWERVERQAALVARIEELEKEMDQAEKDRDYEKADALGEEYERLRAELDADFNGAYGREY